MSAEIIDQFGDAEFSADILQHRDGVHELVIVVTAIPNLKRKRGRGKGEPFFLFKLRIAVVVIVETPFEIRLVLRLEGDDCIDVGPARDALVNKSGIQDAANPCQL